MKHILTHKVFGATLLIIFSPAWAGLLDSPVDRAIAATRSEAIEQRMPPELFGVPWLTPTSALLRSRPNVVPQGDRYYVESILYFGRKANVSYDVKTGNVLMYIINFTDGTSNDQFMRVYRELDKNFGPMSKPEDEVDEYGKKRCSHRRSLRFAVDHCVRFHGQAVFENIVFWRRTPN